MKERQRKIYGVGVNDAPYEVYETEIINGKRKITWSCPFYKRWSHMLERSYSKKYHEARPTYRYCSTTPEWHSFMAFRSWMEKQDWEGKVLDKDLLIKGNKLYSPDTCCFINARTNSFLTESTASRGEFPIGVNKLVKRNKYRSRCHNVLTGKRELLGDFDTPEQAYFAWLQYKSEQAKILADEEGDPRAKEALLSRYKDYY